MRMTANGVHTKNINTNNTEISYDHLSIDGGFIHNILLEYIVKRLVTYLYIHIIKKLQNLLKYTGTSVTFINFFYIRVLLSTSVRVTVTL